MYRKVTEIRVKEIYAEDTYSTYIFVVKDSTLFVGSKKDNGKILWSKSSRPIDSTKDLAISIAC